VREARRLTTWLLHRCEDRSLCDDGGEPRPMTVNRLRTGAEVVATARKLKGEDAGLADVLKEIIAEEHVPFLAAYRYKPSGLAKRAKWERTSTAPTAACGATNGEVQVIDEQVPFVTPPHRIPCGFSP
jgi:hypothetical protein